MLIHVLTRKQNCKNKLTSSKACIWFLKKEFGYVLIMANKRHRVGSKELKNLQINKRKEKKKKRNKNWKNQQNYKKTHPHFKSKHMYFLQKVFQYIFTRTYKRYRVGFIKRSYGKQNVSTLKNKQQIKYQIKIDKTKK